MQDRPVISGDPFVRVPVVLLHPLNPPLSVTDPDAVAFCDMVMAGVPSTAVIIVPAGMPGPETAWPTAGSPLSGSPVILAVPLLVVPVRVRAFSRGSAVISKGAPVCVWTGCCDMVICEGEDETAVMLVPARISALATASPAARPVVAGVGLTLAMTVGLLVPQPRSPVMPVTGVPESGW